MDQFESFKNKIEQDQEQKVENATTAGLSLLIQPDQYVGEVYSIGYESALVQIHDYHREKVGGIPSLCFLVATRFQPGKQGFEKEEASVLLLRVMDAASLPTDVEAERVRVESARRVSGEVDSYWDGQDVMDAHTSQLLSFAGVRCRVIGTFYLEQRPGSLQSDDLVLKFGCDLSNYYPNRGLKVYKPNGSALKNIVNFVQQGTAIDTMPRRVALGMVRYASTNRSFQGVNDVPVDLLPQDLLAQKTALFGMTRSGKSNTTKIILQSVFGLRFGTGEKKQRIGQIVFDPNGEYANENTQDVDGSGNASAIKNVWQTDQAGQETDVITYGITPHPDDPKRHLMLLNFFEDEHLQTGKDIINGYLAEVSGKYIENFVQVKFEQPDPTDRSATTRFNRHVLVYRALLARAGFATPSTIRPGTSGLFNSELIKAMADNTGSKSANYNSAAVLLDAKQTSTPSWSQIAVAMRHLADFLGEDDYKQFETWYVTKRPNASGDTWADEALGKLLKMFQEANGPRTIGKALPQHTSSTQSDYAADIYNDLIAGRLVIVDQSSGEPDLNRSSSQRIMWHIFREQQKKFREGKTPEDVIVYAEEAHNLLPAGSDLDMKDVWVRTAKEGAKYHIGLVYATQEVSSIQRNILKNTANWFIGHLNNSDETHELCKFYDFADFEPPIRRAQDKGFLRVKTLSNLFVLPVQVRLFKIDAIASTAGNKGVGDN